MSDPTKTEFKHDGIEEYDRPLPVWWSRIFLISLAVCPCYWVFFHGGAAGRSMTDYYDLALAESVRKQFEQVGELAPDSDTLTRALTEDSWLRFGGVVFRKHCASCHGRDGEGKVGPNLTDENYKHVQKIEDIATVVADGANNNAMPAWGRKLHPNEVVLVSAYVASLRGQNATGGKSAEGALIDPWPDPPAESVSPPSPSNEKTTETTAQ